MSSGSCPYCRNIIASVRLESVTASAGAGAKALAYNAISYVCPHCSCVLGVALDPLALKNDTVSETVAQVVDHLED